MDTSLISKEIINNISEPTFKHLKVKSISDYGAQGDGRKDNTKISNGAIDSISKDGGGTLYIPQGSFLTGPIHLKNNVNLHLAEGGVIKFLEDPEFYIPYSFYMMGRGRMF